jgi:hypothetical protein
MTITRRDEEEQQAPQQNTQDAQALPYTPNLPPDIPEEDRWQLYAVQAVNGLYPRLRNGVDFAIGRRDPGSPIELLEQGEGVNIDMGKVQEHAQLLADRDPYGPCYTPRPPLHGGSVRGEGEVPPPGEGQPTSDTLARDRRTAGMSPTAGQPTDPALRTPPPGKPGQGSGPPEHANNPEWGGSKPVEPAEPVATPYRNPQAPEEGTIPETPEEP